MLFLDLNRELRRARVSGVAARRLVIVGVYADLKVN